MTTADLHTSTGAYALHALPDDEQRAFVKHLEACEACRNEVAELQATAVRLGRAVAMSPPQSMREAVLGRVATTRQEFTLLQGDETRRRMTWLPRLMLAASVAAAAAFGGVAIWQHQEASEARASVRQAQERMVGVADVLAAPDAQLQTRKLPDGSVATVAVSHRQDAAALVVSGLPQLPTNKVYEAWFIDASGDAAPAGLLSRDAGRQLALLEGPVGEAAAVAFTVEPAGGSPQPTTVPLGSVTLPT
ncbi:anti-sigma factor domain-containing protein [Streptomyces sp. NPDC058685]|uniref:anti-sigma factor n=1 Tax=Streptomyces sp. NPDC058685 TaxID=3346598 RepID=UPI003654BC36